MGMESVWGLVEARQDMVYREDGSASCSFSWVGLGSFFG